MAPDDVRAEAERLAGLGFDAHKVKVGAAGLARDREVIRALRDAVGPGADLAVDYNQTLPVPEAIRRIHALADEDLLWVDEPAAPGAAHARLEGPRCGGWPGWRRPAPRPSAAGLPLSSHFWPEISAALLTV